MKVKNNIIIALVSNGALNITANEFEPEQAGQAYKVIKFRRAVQKAFEALQEAEKAIITECKLEIGDKGVLNGKDEDKEKFAKLRTELYNDEADLGEVKTLPYNVWHKLKGENKWLGNAFIEDNLEGVLWKAPETEE